MYIGICAHCHWISNMNMKFSRHLRKHTKSKDAELFKDFIEVDRIEDLTNGKIRQKSQV